MLHVLVQLVAVASVEGVVCLGAYGAVGVGVALRAVVHVIRA
jgi:hypothetical protein